MIDDIGGRLRRAREQRGLTLQEIARRTRLTRAVLQAIERNDFASLPGGLYRKAYLRTVAGEVGLDPNEIAAGYSAQFEPAIEPPAVPDRNAARERKWVEQLTPSPRRSILTTAVLAAAGAAWFIFQPGPARPDVVVHNVASESIAVWSATPTAVAAHATEVPLRIEMAATGWCWVTAETDGERVMYRLVGPGEHLILEGQHLISVRLGDAGAVTLSFNEGASRSFGRDGEVVELEVTPDTVNVLRNGVVQTLSDV